MCHPSHSELDLKQSVEQTVDERLYRAHLSS